MTSWRIFRRTLLRAPCSDASLETGDCHDPRDFPIIVAGRAKGAILPDTDFARSFGDPAGPLEGLS